MKLKFCFFSSVRLSYCACFPCPCAFVWKVPAGKNQQSVIVTLTCFSFLSPAQLRVSRNSCFLYFLLLFSFLYIFNLMWHLFFHDQCRSPQLPRDIYIYTHTHTYIYTHTHTHTHIYIYMHTHIICKTYILHV